MSEETHSQPLSDYLRERGRSGVADMIEQAERAAQPQPVPDVAATEALRWFAVDGQWLTCTDDGRLDLRAELLAVRRAVQQAFDLAVPAADPTAGTALLAELRDRMGVGEPVDRPGDQWAAPDFRALIRDNLIPEPAPELAAAMAETRERLDVLEERIGNLAAGLKLSASASQPSKKSEIEMSVHRALLALLDPR